MAEAQTTEHSVRLKHPDDLRRAVEEVVATTRVIDMHTHLFAPSFRELNLWGIDDLLTYHYLIAELFRSSTITPAQFYELEKSARADLIWEYLFVRQTPLSEATRGVVAALSTLGLDPSRPDLSEARAYFKAQDPDRHLDQVLELSGVERIVMTNDPLDHDELYLWERKEPVDPRFSAAIRMDGILNEWVHGSAKIAARGYQLSPDFAGKTISELRRFVEASIDRMRPAYLAVSLPDDFSYPEKSDRGRLIRDLILPVCRERGLPFALMIGVRRAVNPALRLAGDGLGRADLAAINHLCAENPENRFLVTFLSRENQHELCVSARKFANLMPFGCWWFLNNPSIIAEITRERLELLGTSFIAQHSDARILEQLIYKWQHSRRTIAAALAESYEALRLDGREVTREEIGRDVRRLFADNFQRWTVNQA
jgi:hypothetical protein